VVQNTPSDFHLLLHLKKFLGGKRFEDDDDLKDAVQKWLTSQAAAFYEVKVKCALAQALRLCTGRTAHGGSRGIALLFHDHGTRRG